MYALHSDTCPIFWDILMFRCDQQFSIVLYVQYTPQRFVMSPSQFTPTHEISIYHSRKKRDVFSQFETLR